MNFARVNGVVIHHEVRGTVGKPVLVFSNSLGTDFRIWDAVVARLESEYRIVLYDKRGHGLSEGTPQPYALTDHVDDLAALLDHLDITGATIVGLSVGGMIAQGLASRWPHLVSRLVLCDTAHKIGTEELWSTRIETVNTRGIAAISDGILERWFTAAFRSPENPDFIGYTAMLTRTAVDGYAGTGFALRDADLTESTRALKLPTLCIVGDRDGSTPPDLVREMADLIEGARFEIVKDAGHLPCIEQPAATASLIADFLRETTPDA
ncbi:3-oxoadipate enol-lactonase [uncultured Nitratireductor sp.]|uniref:3-oxoadipate enol-lactonase n=1 Tax=uncultured Nitratireductor sp. TaxID=520953 RepID=UPI0025E46D4C|nr:3-oxoadipate enol-lactonase [uncultured Nitratireductor sp.]